MACPHPSHPRPSMWRAPWRPLSSTLVLRCARLWGAGVPPRISRAIRPQFPINSKDSANGVPGVLIGRYVGDMYGGGNPWILLSAYLAQSFYRGAQYTQSVRALPEPEAMRRWRAVMPQLRADVTHEEFATQLLQMGDGVMQRIYFHVMGAGFHLSEQLDRVTGVEFSAFDLTWSYATVLQALQLRSRVASA